MIRLGAGYFAVVLLCCLAVLARGLERPTLKNLRAGVSTDFDTFAWANDQSHPVYRHHLEGKYSSTGNPYSGFLATFPASRFSFYPPTKQGCTGLYQTSISSSSTFDCEYATNGAFFTWDTTAPSHCIGNLVSDGKVWQLPTDGSGTGRANFGVTADNKIVTGFLDSHTIASTNFTQLITGWGWLVRNGVSYVDSSGDLSYQPGGFTLEKAPRTAVGVFKNGSMALLEVDGEEDINYGPDLFEMAELLVSVGVESAVNIDGGGSSVSVAQGKVISLPTCNDTPEICERAVASITCVRNV